MISTGDARETRTFYYDAYSGEYTVLWISTPYKNEIADLCFARASNCWLRENELAEEDRRKLLYSFLKTNWATDETVDSLNENYPNLSTDNLNVKRIINNIAYAYNQPPARQYLINSEEVAYSEDINQILKDLKFNQYMRQAYRLGLLVNEIALRPHQVNDVWRIDLLTPDMYRTTRDEMTGEVLEMVIPFQIRNKYGEPVNRYKVWTKEKLVVKDTNWQDVQFDYKGKNVSYVPNDYGQVPYVFLRMFENPDIYGGGEWELIKAQLTCNMIDYLRDENLIYGSIGLWFFQNLNIKASEIKFNPGRVFVRNEIVDTEYPPNIQYISATPVWSELELAKESILKGVVKRMGLPSSMLSDNPGLQSGVSLKIDRMEMEERRREDLEVLQKFEQDFINTLIKFNNIENNTNYKEIELRVDYAENPIYTEPKDELEYQKALLNAGLITIQNYVTVLTGNDSIKSDEEAIEFINKNKENLQLIGVSNDGSGTEGGEPKQAQRQIENGQEVLDVGTANKELGSAG